MFAFFRLCRLASPCISLQMLTCPVTRPASEANAQVCVIGLCNRYANYAFGTPLKKPCCKKTTILGRYAIARTFEWPAKSSDVFGCPLLKQAASPKITEKNPYLRGQKGTSEDSDGLWWTSPMRLIRNQQVTGSNPVVGSSFKSFITWDLQKSIPPRVSPFKYLGGVMVPLK